MGDLAISGARVNITGGSAMKVGAVKGEGNHAHVLMQVSTKFVHVHLTSSDGTRYIMERLEELSEPGCIGAYEGFVQSLCMQLSRLPAPAFVNFEAVMMRNKISTLLQRAEKAGTNERCLTALWYAADLYRSRLPMFSLIHGDPTWSNIMQRGEGGPWVLIDPIPPKPWVPPVQEVDESKVMQSLLGWDLPYDRDRVDFQIGRSGDLVMPMTAYTLLRILPYIREDVTLRLWRDTVRNFACHV